MPTAAQSSTASSPPHGPSGMGGTRAASPGKPTPARDGDDACPGALRLHAADDGALARVRVPGGVLTATQASALAEAAERLGDGELHLTSRGNVQLRGLAQGCGTDLAGVLAGSGLLPSARHERVRNVVASPLSGLDGQGHADVLPWAAELDRLLCESPAAAGLSGRFLFALDDGRGDVAALGADVTVTADPHCPEPAEGADLAGVSPRCGPALGAEPRHPDAPGASDAPATATVYVGGTAAVRVPAGAAPQTALLAAELFLGVVQERGGKAWRVGELPDGAEAVARALAGRLADDATAGGGCPAPGAGRQGAAGAHPDSTGTGTGPEPGTVHSPDGRTVALSVTAPFGTLTSAQWHLLAATAATHGTGTLRLTPWRGVVVPGLRPDAARAQLAELGAAGLVTSPDSPWHGLGACAGRPGCAKARADVRADAREAVRHRSGHARDPRELPVHWSGCPRRCGRPKGPHVDVVATGDDRYDVSLHAHGTVDGEGVTTTVRNGLAAAVAAAAARTTAAER